MNKTIALEVLLQEYPFLQKQSTRIKKQFVFSDGRTSNTFLVESNKSGFEKYIAKSFVHHSNSLIKEWTLLQLLHKKHAKAPRLLVPDHKPVSFLLMEYIDGVSARDALAAGKDEREIFHKLGETTGQINSIELENFGDIFNPDTDSWKDSQLEKLENAWPLVRSLLEKDISDGVRNLIEEKKYILDEESKGPPQLVHHDIYLDNFLLTQKNELILIDYGIAFGGRPLFDLAKFFIWDLSLYPDQKEVFLDMYKKYVPLPSNFSDVMTFYVIRECFGMIDFFHKINDKKARDLALSVLRDFAFKQGALYRLLH